MHKGTIDSILNDWNQSFLISGHWQQLETNRKNVAIGQKALLFCLDGYLPIGNISGILTGWGDLT